MREESIIRATAAMEADVPLAESDPTRPIYHFRPPAGYHNDPNGLIRHEGYFHLFYQFHPFTSGRGKGDEIFWGHARSSDLVHWEHLPLAIWPSTESGEERCASGSTVIAPDGTPLILYTSLGDRASQAGAPDQWAAIGDAELVAWQKHPDNPILSARAHGQLRISQWRDPFVFADGDDWFMLVGGRVHRDDRERGCIAIYRAEDDALTQWQYVNILHEWPDDTVTSLECPNLFRFDDRWVLFFSYYPPATNVACLVGSFDGTSGVFSVEDEGRLDLSPMGTYAHQGMRDESGRVIVFGWVRGAGWYPGGGRGWSGCMSLPTVLSLGPDGKTRQQPAPEIFRLRGKHRTMARLALRDTVRVMEGISGDRLEILAEFKPRDAAAFGLIVRRSNDGVRGVAISFDGSQVHLTGADPEGVFDGAREPSPGGDYRIPFVLLEEEEKLRLHLFLDGCVMEQFLNERACISRAIYSPPADRGVALFAEGGEVELLQLDAWEMSSAW